jgi:hypothetical protein
MVTAYCLLPTAHCKLSMSSTLIYIIAGYAVIILLVYLVQERFIFKPEKLKQDFVYKYDLPFKELFFDVEPGVTINGLHFNVKDPRGLVSWEYKKHKRMGEICKGFLSLSI